MKTKILAILPLAAALLMMAACNDIVDYNDGYTPASAKGNSGAPQISAIYDIGDDTTPITQGSLGQMVRIVGHNLNDVRSITFNGIEADLAQCYFAADSAFVVIPSRTNFQGDGQMVYTTGSGSVSTAFPIPVPDLQVSGLENEFADAGDTVSVIGRFFDIYDFGNVATSTVTVNGTATTVTANRRDTMKVAIPAGTPDNSTVVISWQGSDGSHSVTLPFRPTAHLLYPDLASTSINNGGFTYAVEADDALPTTASRLGRANLHVTGSYGAWSWNTLDLSANMIDAGIAGGLDDYVLKMEVLTATSHPLTENSPLQMCFNWGGSYTWEPGGGLGLNTAGQWRTVTMPLAPMATNGISGAGVWQTLRIVLQPHADYTADFRIANLRIEHR